MRNWKNQRKTLYSISVLLIQTIIRLHGWLLCRIYTNLKDNVIKNVSPNISVCKYRCSVHRFSFWLACAICVATIAGHGTVNWRPSPRNHVGQNTVGLTLPGQTSAGCITVSAWGCVKTLTQLFYVQSPDFLKPGLCYYPKFSYL